MTDGEKPFKKMNKYELQQLFEEIYAEIEIIKAFFQNLENYKQNLNEANAKILGESGLASQIEKKSGEINVAYNEILVDDGQRNSVKTQIEELLAKFTEDKKQFNKLKDDIFGYEQPNETGEVQKIMGLSDEITDFYQKQREKYSTLYSQIEGELRAGATSVNLSKSFSDKVGEYKKASLVWSSCFIGLMVLLISVGYYDFLHIPPGEVKTAQDIWRHLAFRAPFLVFGVWLAIFFGNRRAESKKLEESYKHKEVMARSFVGYKKTLEDLGDEDKALLKEHMQNLLKTMNENSGDFLDSKGDKHPIFEAVHAFTDRFKRKDKEE